MLKLTLSTAFKNNFFENSDFFCMKYFLTHLLPISFPLWFSPNKWHLIVWLYDNCFNEGLSSLQIEVYACTYHKKDTPIITFVISGGFPNIGVNLFSYNYFGKRISKPIVWMFWIAEQFLLPASFSIIIPEYMTMTLSHVFATTPISWVINTTLLFLSALISLIRFNTLCLNGLHLMQWSVSSAIISFGFKHKPLQS